MPRHAEIAGAGIAGLTMATVLAQQGWSVCVHERSDELREIGAGIFIWPNGVRALSAIGALDGAVAGGSAMSHWSIVDDRRRTLQDGDLQDAFCIARPELHRSLLRAARSAGVEVRTESTAMSATGDGELLLTSGEVRKADLVVGADGINSRVRDSLPLKVSRYDLRYGSQRLFVERSEDDPPHANPEYWHRSWRMGFSACGPDRLYVYLFSRPDDRVGRREPFDHAAWTKAFPDAASVVARLPERGEWREIMELRCERWSHGRAVLLGDAAHAMAPNWGQGANSTMLSAVKLGETLDGAAVPEAVAAWEREHRHVVERVQRYSRLYSDAMTRWPAPLVDVRSALAWGFGRSPALQRRLTGAV